MKEQPRQGRKYYDLNPRLNEGSYVFTTSRKENILPRGSAICEFREKEGVTMIVDKEIADNLDLPYTYVARWISLDLNTSLDDVGLTAKFSQALAEKGISCNVLAAYHHDHIFVAEGDELEAMKILKSLPG